MNELVARRGPDDEQYWTDSEGNLALGFRRLSVMDPSPAGRQPMISSDGRSVIVFNGEIYNYRELGRSLETEGHVFRSRGDTEVLLEGLNRWGTELISKLNGMFAFAWYERSRRRLVLARDHAGIKPLYLYRHPTGKGLAFGSQFNQLLATPWGDPGDLELEVLSLYLRLHHIPAPFGLLRNTSQVRPGRWIEVQKDLTIREHRWWSLEERGDQYLTSDRAQEAVRGAIESSISRQRVADVPVGVFLSGGIDSPLVASEMARQANRKMRAYTVGNPEWNQDEEADSSRYADLIGVEHRVLRAGVDRLESALEQVACAQFEPFADYSILPSLLLSEFCRPEITVALSGDGGDELFFGYERPVSLLGNGADFRRPWSLRVLMYLAGKYGIGRERSDVIVARSPGEYYFEVNSRLRAADMRRLAPDLPDLPSSLEIYDSGPYRDQRQLAEFSRRAEFEGQLQRCLKKLDMASMYHGLEVRVPLLDIELVNTALHIAPEDCMRDGRRKALLQDLLGKYLPPEAIPATKRGFSVPLGEWLRGPLRTKVEGTLCEQDLFPSGLFDRQAVARYVADHMSGRRDLKWGLWTLLSLQWWADSHYFPLVERPSA